VTDGEPQLNSFADIPTAVLSVDDMLAACTEGHGAQTEQHLRRASTSLTRWDQSMLTQ